MIMCLRPCVKRDEGSMVSVVIAFDLLIRDQVHPHNVCLSEFLLFKPLARLVSSFLAELFCVQQLLEADELE